jgi:hypothetical protein
VFLSGEVELALKTYSKRGTLLYCVCSLLLQASFPVPLTFQNSSQLGYCPPIDGSWDLLLSSFLLFWRYSLLSIRVSLTGCNLIWLAIELKWRALDKLHSKAIALRQASTPEDKARYISTRAEYEQRATADLGHPSPIRYLTIAVNILTVGFGLFVFWYILAMAVLPFKLNDSQYDHLIVALILLSFWFPARAYSEWYIHFESSDHWLDHFPAYLVMGFVFLLTVVLLVMRRTQGNVVTRLATINGLILPDWGYLRRPDPISSARLL